MSFTKHKVTIGDIEFTRRPMVKWFDPRQLFQTAFRVLVSSVFSTYADKRESFAAGVAASYSYTHKKEVWLDYIADLGDGWNPTYYTAHLLAKANLTVDQYSTCRGDLLIMGGDQVYPTASREEYQNRLWGPYETALPNEKVTDGKPHLYAIPGNHDWYDGLNNFMKFFCQQRSIGAWETQQHRSYFAIQLTPTCWLWGIDIQLNSDIDKPQLNYFKEIATKRMQDDNHVILCTAEPAWVNCDKEQAKEKYEKLAYFRKSNIDCIEYTEVNNGIPSVQTRKLNLILLLAGDLHHYARYSHSVDGKTETHHITAGGGGTFLHPTHNLAERITWTNKHTQQTETFTLQKSFPDKKTSARLTYQNSGFPFKNLSFSLFLGTLYLFLGWVLQSSSITYGENFITTQSLFHTLAHCPDISCISQVLLNVVKFNPAALLLLVVLVAGFMGFADTKSSNKKNRIAALGFLHGLVHVLAAFFTIWAFSHLKSTCAAVDVSNWGIPTGMAETWVHGILSVGSVAVMLVGGGMLGGFITGLYFIVTNLIFKVHDNEAFSSFRHQDYKNFLRFHITPEKITIYPVGIKRVPRRWQETRTTSDTNPSFVEPAATETKHGYGLIETPIEILLQTHASQKPDTPLKQELARNGAELNKG